MPSCNNQALGARPLIMSPAWQHRFDSLEISNASATPDAPEASAIRTIAAESPITPSLPVVAVSSKTSQRGTTRKASATKKEASNTRMPFEAAEALLWGKTTYEQHQFLYGRMKKLEEQQLANDTRIQTTEAVMEAAEAAISRVRRLEQHVAAIETDNHENPFNNWVTAEVEGLKTFTEKHKNIRQKQIELEKLLSNVLDDLDTIRNMPTVMQDLARRMMDMETRSTADTIRIRDLEECVKNLAMMGSSYEMENSKLRTELSERQALSPTMRPPSRQPDLIMSDISEETEDEGCTVRHKHVEREQIDTQPPRELELEVASCNTVVALPLSKAQKDMSARLRMMQRKSIHEPKRYQGVEKQQDQLVASSQEHTRLTANALPATQIVNRLHKPDQRMPVKRVQDTTSNSAGKKLIVKLPITALKKRKRIEEQEQQQEDVPRMTRSQAQAQKIAQVYPKVTTATIDKGKSDEPTCLQPNTTGSKNALLLPETQIINQPARKRERLDDSKHQTSMDQRAKGPMNEVNSHEDNLVGFALPPSQIAVPAAKTGSCTRCRTRKTRCDRVHPVCSNCKNNPQHGACVYLEMNKRTANMESGTKRNIKALSRANNSIQRPNANGNPLRKSSRKAGPEKLTGSNENTVNRGDLHLPSKRGSRALRK